MGADSVRCLVNSISRYIHLVSCQTLKPLPRREDYINIVGSLKLLKLLLEEAADYNVSSDENLYKECEELDAAINEAREFVEGWSPKLSKISCTLQSGRLLMRIQRSSLEICRQIEQLIHSSQAALSLSAVQHCVQGLKCLELVRVSALLEDALKVQSKGTAPCFDHLIEIARVLDLTTSCELLKENVALEEIRKKVQVNSRIGEVDHVNQIMDLFLHMRSSVLDFDLLKLINGARVPPYFRCPLSLELMVDPVIVASGQTYERASIQKWLDHGLDICPKTRQRLAHKNLIPNYTVKALIANWCDEHNVRLSSSSESDNSSSTPPLSHDSPRTFTNIESFHSSKNNSPSRPCKDLGDRLEKQRFVQSEDKSSDVIESRGTSNSDTTPITSDTPLNYESPKDVIHTDSSHSSHSIFLSRSLGAGHSPERQKFYTSTRLDEDVSNGHNRKSGRCKVTSLTPLNLESLQCSKRTDKFCSSYSSSPPSSFKELENGLENRAINASYQLGEESSDACKKGSEKMNRIPDTSESLLTCESPQNFTCTDSFRSSHNNSPSRSSPDIEGNEKEKVNVFSRSDHRVSDANKSDETAKLEHPSPEQSYVHSRSESLVSGVSSVDNMPTVSTDVSRISDRNDCTSEYSDETPSERPNTSPNKDVDIYPWFPERRLQCSKSRNETPTSRGCNFPSTPASPFCGSASDELTTNSHVETLVANLNSQSKDAQTTAAGELRLLAKHNMENRVIIGHCGAISPLVALLYSEVKKTQEHAVTALLNLSINEDNKAMIAGAGAIEPLIHVLRSGNSEAKENSAAALFSLSVLEEYKEKIGRSGAVKALVELLSSGTLRGKKDAATALFNLSIFHENKARIVQAGAVKHLVEMMDPANGMVDKAVALLANLSTISEGRSAIAREGGIPLLVEVIETGSQRGKENAASVLLQLCLNNTKYCTLVLQEGAVPPLVALSQSGTLRAKEKAQQLLTHFRSQREGANVKKK